MTNTETCTILTTDSAPRLTWLHDRQPVMLMTDKARDTWLSADAISAAYVCLYVGEYMRAKIE